MQWNLIVIVLLPSPALRSRERHLPTWSLTIFEIKHLVPLIDFLESVICRRIAPLCFGEQCAKHGVEFVDGFPHVQERCHCREGDREDFDGRFDRGPGIDGREP